MKKYLLFLILGLVSNGVFSQSLKIDKTDQTSIQFVLSEVDSITFSTAPLSKESITTDAATIQTESSNVSENASNELQKTNSSETGNSQKPDSISIPDSEDQKSD